MYVIDGITVRNTRQDDARSIANLQKESFHDLSPNSIWKEAHIQEHVRLFPWGQFCAVKNDKIVGSCSSFLTKLEPEHKSHTWLEICGDFKFKNHISEGDTLYDADISVHPDFQRLGISKSMNELRKELTKKLNLRRFLSGSRLYGFHKYSDVMTPDEYAKKVVAQELSDPVLSFHLACGFDFIKIMPDYLDDVNSLNYGVLVEWKNPNHTPP